MELFFLSGTKEKRAAGSWKEVILCKSLFAITLEVIDILGSRSTSFSLLSFSSEEKSGLEDAFLKFSPAETLLKERLIVSRPLERSLE